MCLKKNINDKKVFDVLSFINFTHDGSHNEYKREKFSKMKRNKSKYNKKNVVLLLRNEIDTIVSYYFEMKYRNRNFNYEGNIHSFIRDPRFGIRKIVEFYNIWYKNKNIPKNLLVIKYENFHKNVQKELRKLLKFIGVRQIDRFIKKSVEFSSFKNAERMENNNYFSSKRLKPRKKGDKRTYKCRKGKINNYDEYLTKNDIKYANNIIKENKKYEDW